MTDPDRLEEVIAAYENTLYRAALAVLGDAHEAEDAVQDAFLRYLEKAPDFPDTARERAWLLKVTVNCANRFHAMRGRRRTEPLSQALSVPAPEGEGLWEELRRLRESREEETEVSDEIDYALSDMQYNPHDDAPVVDTIDTEGKEEQTRKKEHPVVSDEIDYALNDMQYNPHDDAPVVDTIDIEGKEEQN